MLRALLFKVYFGVMSVAVILGCTPLLLFGPRKSLIWAMRNWAKLTLFGLRTIADIGIEIRGAAHIPAGGALIAAKHLSMWETITFHLLLPDPALVMKQELLAIPLYGRYARRALMIVVDRAGGARTLRRMIAEAKARLAEGRQIVIFPEGTRVPPGAAPDYKPGIAALYAHLGIACHPVALNSGLYWPRRGLVRPGGRILIEFLAPIPPDLPRADFMARLQNDIETGTAHLLAEAHHKCG